MKGDDSTHHSGHQIHPQQQVLEAGVIARTGIFKTIMFVTIIDHVSEVIYNFYNL